MAITDTTEGISTAFSKVAENVAFWKDWTPYSKFLFIMVGIYLFVCFIVLKQAIYKSTDNKLKGKRR